MSTSIRAWLLGVAALVGAIAVVGVVVAGGDNESAQPPRVRVSVPGLETDLFADESSPAGSEAMSDVAVYEGVEQLAAAFDGDAGHPRMILLVDPI